MGGLLTVWVLPSPPGTVDEALPGMEKTLRAFTAPTPTVEPNPRYVQGRTLWMRAEKPVIQAAVHYVGLDTAGRQHNWAIDPVNPGTNIAVVEVTIINATSGSVRLIVGPRRGETAVEGRQRRGEAHRRDRMGRSDQLLRSNPGLCRLHTGLGQSYSRLKRANTRSHGVRDTRRRNSSRISMVGLRRHVRPVLVRSV